METRRWQQQHRACPRVRDRLDPWVRNRARVRLARVFHLSQDKRRLSAQYSLMRNNPDLHVGTRVTIHPPAPLHCLFAIGWGAIGFGWFPTVGAGMTGPTWLFRMEPQTNRDGICSAGVARFRLVWSSCCDNCAICPRTPRPRPVDLSVFKDSIERREQPCT